MTSIYWVNLREGFLSNSHCVHHVMNSIIREKVQIAENSLKKSIFLVPVSPRVPPCCTGYRLAPRSVCLREGNPGASSMCWLPHPRTEGGPAPGLTPLWRQIDTRRRRQEMGESKKKRKERENVCQWWAENWTAAYFATRKKTKKTQNLTTFHFLYIHNLFT